MKKLFSALLAATLVAGSALAAGAASPHGGGLYVFDSSDSEYWAADLAMLDKTAPALWLEDGNAGGYNDPSYTDATGSVLMETLEAGWYEVVLCNLGTNAEWFPADVAGKVALTVRGDSTFTVKSQNAADAGAIACLVGNNNRAAEAVDEEGNVSSGTYENVTMSVEYYTIPMCSIGSDFSARLVAQTAGISIADAVKAVDAVQAGALDLGLEHKQGAWIFIGTEEQYKANTTRSDANTKTGAGATAPAAAEAPAAEAATETAAAGLPAAYPASGTAIPDGSVLIAGELIGSENGWDGTAASGRASAFDGDTATFFDPATASVDYCGIDAGEEMILTKIIIRPRNDWADRFDGATIEASNDPEFAESVELFYNANGAAAEITFIDCTADMETSENTGYRYFRYINYMKHGDVAEVELYGYAKDGSNPTYGAAAATEAPAAEATAAAATETIEIDAVAAYQDYPSMDALANNGAGYATLDEAAASIGKTAITAYTFISGTEGYGNEGAENLWDGDTATKFCSGTFPTTSIVALDGEYAIDGIAMATANDNSSYNNRSPYEWAIYGSNDGSAWTALAYGDDYFFEETDFTYYAAPLTTEGTYKYIMFQSEGGLSGTFQVSEVTMFGTKVESAAPAVEETPVVEEPVVEEPVVEEPVVEEPVIVEETVEETVEEEVVVEEPVVEETVEEEVAEEAAQTFDFGVIAAVAALISAAGYAISKKR